LFAKALNIPVIGVIENMSGFICPHCCQEVNIFKQGGGEHAAAELKVPFLGRVPLDPHLVEAGDLGKPFISFRQDSEAGTAFQKIVQKIEDFLK
jgi:ATP-binding protein involved in chromosome partitioning